MQRFLGGMFIFRIYLLIPSKGIVFEFTSVYFGGGSKLEKEDYFVYNAYNISFIYSETLYLSID